MQGRVAAHRASSADCPGAPPRAGDSPQLSEPADWAAGLDRLRYSPIFVRRRGPCRTGEILT